MAQVGAIVLANRFYLVKVALSHANFRQNFSLCLGSECLSGLDDSNNNRSGSDQGAVRFKPTETALPRLEVPMHSPLNALVVMGVTGCGKSTIGAAIVELSGGRLIEGDSFHPPENIEKMRAGIPLTDDDRAGWLKRLGEEMASMIAQGERPVLTCSALKRRYRDTLRAAVPELGFVFLELTREESAYRVAHRPGHYMPASLVDSQFAALEDPTGEPNTLPLDATAPVSELAAQVDRWLRECGAVNLKQPA